MSETVAALCWRRVLVTLMVLVTLIVLVAGCGQDTPAGEPAAPEITAESKRQTCLYEWMTIEWTGEQLEIVAYLAIDMFEAGDVETSQGLYDSAAQIVDNLPAVAAAFDSRCSVHTPQQVTALHSAVALAQTEWDALQAGCRAGPALQGFRCD